MKSLQQIFSITSLLGLIFLLSSFGYVPASESSVLGREDGKGKEPKTEQSRLYCGVAQLQNLAKIVQNVEKFTTFFFSTTSNQYGVFLCLFRKPKTEHSSFHCGVAHSKISPKQL